MNPVVEQFSKPSSRFQCGTVHNSSPRRQSRRDSQYRFPSSGVCTWRFHKISAAQRAGRPDFNQIGYAFLEQERAGSFSQY